MLQICNIQTKGLISCSDFPTNSFQISEAHNYHKLDFLKLNVLVINHWYCLSMLYFFFILIKHSQILYKLYLSWPNSAMLVFHDNCCFCITSISSHVTLLHQFQTLIMWESLYFYIVSHTNKWTRSLMLITWWVYKIMWSGWLTWLGLQTFWTWY